ncbi:hypothetical protein BDR26DRAFT_1013151 [Obelidium mucronatum]|nr:hypothetical protein BDR26DRAFT_1013151 [Obelidium mucronatum]
MTYDQIVKFAKSIGVLAVCSGVATVNGQQWIDDIDILDNLDIVYSPEDGETGFDIAMKIKQWLGYSSPKAELLVVCIVEMKSLCIDLARLFQVPMNESSDTLEELTNQCADAFEKNGAADFQDLITALRNLDSLTITPHVCKVLSAAVILLKHKLDYEFPEFHQIVTARPDTSLENRQINDLSIPLRPTWAVDGVLFGHTFLVDWQRALSEGFYNFASHHVSDTVKFSVARQFSEQENPKTSHIRVDFEAWNSEVSPDRIDEQTLFTFEKYGGNVVRGAGSFFCVFKFSNGEVAFLQAAAIDWEVTEIVITYNPV